MKISLFFVTAALCCCLLACNNNGQTDNSNPILTIESGKIQGVESETAGVYVYRGIPFAAPPIGDNRWRAPQPVEAWDTIMIADSWGNPAPQAPHVEGSFYTTEFFFDGDPEFSEDCLQLNIWTPAPGQTDKKLPVALWIHGGGYNAGWGFEPEMDGEAWAERGVILVTINYRLGIFGFMAHPDLSAEAPYNASGNYGILDQLEAIKWTKRNIEQFGGDPNKITIFGQSAGAGSVQALVASPLIEELICGAIIQSGGGVSERPMLSNGSLDEAEKSGKALMDFGGYTTLEAMRSASTKEIFELSSRYSRETRQYVSARPIVDNYLLTTDFSHAAIDGAIADIPYMIGFTKDDMGNMTEAIATFCLLREQQGRDAYAYQFARPLPGDNAGAFHSSELWFIFHTIDRCWRPFVEADESLSVQMVNAWTNFAKTGNPNGEGVASWSPYKKESPEFMIFKLNDDNTAVSSAMGQPLPSEAAGAR